MHCGEGGCGKRISIALIILLISSSGVYAGITSISQLVEAKQIIGAGRIGN